MGNPEQLYGAPPAELSAHDEALKEQKVLRLLQMPSEATALESQVEAEKRGYPVPGKVEFTPVGEAERPNYVSNYVELLKRTV